MEENSKRDIAGIQRSEIFQRYLKASTWLYSRAKLIRSAQLVLTILIPIALAILSTVFSDQSQSKVGLKGWAAFYGIAISIFDIAILESAQASYKKRAAKVQESFDSRLLVLPWNDLKVGDRLSPEDVDQWARSLKRELTEEQRNWYPAVASDQPLYLSRIICQRANLWWDHELRRKFMIFLIGITISLSVTMAAVGLWKEMTLPVFILSIMAPISPTLMWFAKEIKKQKESSQNLDRLMKYALGLWRDALTRKDSRAEIAAKSRELQDEIFVHRYSNQPIPNWFNRLFSSSFDVSMNQGADELAEEAKTSLKE